MGRITHAIAKKLAANNGDSEASEAVAAKVDTVANDKNTTVNADTEGDVSGNRVPTNDKDLDTEVLQPKIYEESESNQLAHILLFQNQESPDASVVRMQLVRPNHVVLRGPQLGKAAQAIEHRLQMVLEISVRSGLMPVSLANEVVALLIGQRQIKSPSPQHENFALHPTTRG
ncbi:hypothetical protein ACEPAG_2656 [Sanghuangporus baumii]